MLPKPKESKRSQGKRPGYLTEIREQISSAVMCPQLRTFFQWCFGYKSRVGMSWKNTIGKPRMSLTWFWWGSRQMVDEEDNPLHSYCSHREWIKRAKRYQGKKKKQGQQRNEPQVSSSESCSETHLQGGEIGCLQVNTVFGIANFFRGKLNQKHLCLLPDALSCYFVSKFLISWGNEEYSKQLIMEHECGSSQEIISLQEIERGKKSTQLAKEW